MFHCMYIYIYMYIQLYIHIYICMCVKFILRAGRHEHGRGDAQRYAWGRRAHAHVPLRRRPPILTGSSPPLRVSLKEGCSIHMICILAAYR